MCYNVCIGEGLNSFDIWILINSLQVVLRSYNVYLTAKDKIANAFASVKSAFAPQLAFAPIAA